jgi:hypothetical protein
VRVSSSSRPPSTDTTKNQKRMHTVNIILWPKIYYQYYLGDGEAPSVSGQARPEDIRSAAGWCKSKYCFPGPGGLYRPATRAQAVPGRFLRSRFEVRYLSYNYIPRERETGDTAASKISIGWPGCDGMRVFFALCRRARPGAWTLPATARLPQSNAHRTALRRPPVTGRVTVAV